MIYYLVMRVQPWSDLEVEARGLPLSAVRFAPGPEFGYGFLPVYKSLSEARKYWPDNQIKTIETTTTEEVGENV